ncbi:type II secretion system protein F [Flavimobilis marinus]|uniref:Tight adherence protein B n=1 Tax=Flavimobilis marinus TaxID=285351 RepID=A0A1I2DSN7_9MICO|nr:type II secretion system F family protein [Flavimobilis marinus]GHG44431.1 type II secretion system protein F [Flavimobilis marinus]SFE83555.1 tight adherence protein B [Flavimobilis marinus]
MGVVSGLLLGAGVLLVWLSCWDVPTSRRRGASRSRDILVQAGLPDITPLRLTAVSVGVGVAVATMAVVLTRALPIAGAFGLMAAYGPWAIVLGRARKRRNDLREVWPEVVDHLASGVRAGLALPEAVSQLATRGPVALRAEFADFARDYRATGRFSECLDELKDRMADPVADRIVEALRLTREVGGTDLGRLLRTLSEFLRDDNRTRGELEARQSWTVAGARLAVAGPWVVLAFLATRPETAAAYSSVQGAAVLGVGGLSCLVAYRVMLRIGRLPDDVRVLR